mmetsp:Transcript_13559/g.41181  ORF Transcript_13559/g.41181 Transcript_13559/m.41181 type:complete len:269 (+) Transcript_13559:1424-2230(+)
MGARMSLVVEAPRMHSKTQSCVADSSSAGAKSPRSKSIRAEPMSVSACHASHTPSKARRPKTKPKAPESADFLSDERARTSLQAWSRHANKTQTAISGVGSRRVEAETSERARRMCAKTAVTSPQNISFFVACTRMCSAPGLKCDLNDTPPSESADEMAPPSSSSSTSSSSSPSILSHLGSAAWREERAVPAEESQSERGVQRTRVHRESVTSLSEHESSTRHAVASCGLVRWLESDSPNSAAAPCRPISPRPVELSHNKSSPRQTPK